MRIISGKLKGRRINPPGNLVLRPTTDMAKESLFNILANLTNFEGITVLDLFSGTGSIACEFVSRGAKEVTAVEQNFKCISFIRQTASGFKMDNLITLRANVFSFLKKTGKKWDLIFADPPFDLKEITQLPPIIFEKGLLTEEGIFVLEHGKENSFEGNPYLFDHRVYSRVNFSFFSKQARAE